MSDKVTSFPTSRAIEPGSVIRLKSGSPAMTVSKIVQRVNCSYFDSNTGTFIEEVFDIEQLELDLKKVDQSKFNSFG